MPDPVLGALIGVGAGLASGVLAAWIADKATRRAAIEQAHATVLAAVVSKLPNISQDQLCAVLRLVNNPYDANLQQRLLSSTPNPPVNPTCKEGGSA